MRTEAEARAAIVAAVQRLEATGLNHGSSGNVSVRWQDGALITPTGAGASLTPEEVVHVDLDGGVIGAGIPSSEWRFHTEILRHRPEAGAVVHTHADACVALSCLRRPLPAFHYMVASFGGTDVRCADYRVFGSDALAAAALRALEGRYACLLANHGMIAFGRDLSHALSLTVKLETLARQYLLSCQGGAPVVLSADDMAEVAERYKVYGVAAMPR
ncbi:class II aldolase [Acuticoccus sediminis]|uniref:Class II aldolase n=1 Tax=Acuticoccus sediminis TaxID=2184697 RepID=A0A8B2NQ67_9HYPH|nr:class II aldolase/adducin family protein [Acuticoccus sediminis]RAI00812.1 class II aldolase [Acuticoccus sediminis]